MSADQESKNTSPNDAEQTSSDQTQKKSGRGSKGAAQIYRVNRLGREIFVGERDLLIQAMHNFLSHSLLSRLRKLSWNYLLTT